MTSFSDKFLEKVLRACEEHAMFPADCSRVVAAVSGGADSVCMLHALHSLKDKLGIKIFVAHLDHAVRGEASAADARFVEDFAKSLGLEFHLGRISDNVPPAEGDGSPEALLRNARHRFLSDIAEKTCASRIAVAHNRDDQVETVLMRIIRGTSLLGVTGMRPVHDRIVRPLFFIPRADIEKYCAENSLAPRTDESNTDERFTRNRVRHRLLPMLEEDFNPAVRDKIFNLYQLLSGDSEYLEAMGAENFEALVTERAPGRISLNIKELAAQPDPLLKRAVRAAALELLGDDGGLLQAEHINSVVAIVQSKTGGLTAEIPRLRVTAHYETLEFLRNDIKTEAAPPPGDVAIKIPTGAKNFALRDFGVELVFEDVAFCEEMLKNADPSTAFFDREKLALDKLSVRRWREGDTFRPLGAPGIKKLSDFFIDEKIDREKRTRIPLLCSGTHIAWVVGHRTGHDFRIIQGGASTVLKVSARALKSKSPDGC